MFRSLKRPRIDTYAFRAAHGEPSWSASCSCDASMDTFQGDFSISYSHSYGNRLQKGSTIEASLALSGGARLCKTLCYGA